MKYKSCQICLFKDICNKKLRKGCSQLELEKIDEKDKKITSVDG